MADYLIQGENLTSIADKIRVLSGTEDAMDLDAMKTKLQEANTEVNVYTDELANLNDAISALELELRKKTNIDVEINILTKKLSSNSTSISFTGLTEEPKMFAISPTGNITLSSTRYVTSVMYDGSTTRGTYGYRSSSSATSYHSSSYFTWTYSNGTLTVKTSSSTNGGNFSSSVTYQLAYVTTTEGSLGGNTSDGVQLPTLTNEGTAADLMSGKQLIDGSGNIVTGTHECTSTGGVEVERGTVYGVNGTNKTITLGWKPDAVFFTGINSYTNQAVHAGVTFTEANVSSMTTYFTGSSNSYVLSALGVTQTSTGFKIRGIRINTSLEESNESNRTLNYIAIKYS